MAIIGVNAYCQRDVWNGSFDMATLGGTDTVLYKSVEDTSKPNLGAKRGFSLDWGIEFEFISVLRVCGDAIINIGYSQNKNTFTQYIDDRLPYTMIVGDSAAVNGIYKASEGWDKVNFAYRYYAVKISKGSCTSGVVTWTLTQR